MEGEVRIYADETLRRLDRLMSTDAVVRKQLRQIMRVAIGTARKEVVSGARGSMKSDPRAARKAVRSSVYKKVIGGNVNILDKRGGRSEVREWNKTRKLQPGQWGGNRRARSARTEQVDGYYGTARAFILRFLNAGTSGRVTRYGYRGQLSGWRWFTPSGVRGMDKASEELRGLIARAAVELWNK